MIINIVIINFSFQYDKLLGYCPQNDALNYDLTGRELLNFFAKIRGVENVDDTVSELLTQLGKRIKYIMTMIRIVIVKI